MSDKMIKVDSADYILQLIPTGDRETAKTALNRLITEEKIKPAEHILNHIMPNNDEAESYDRADLLEVFNEIQDYVNELKLKESRKEV